MTVSPAAVFVVKQPSVKTTSAQDFQNKTKRRVKAEVHNEKKKKDCGLKVKIF